MLSGQAIQKSERVLKLSEPTELTEVRPREEKEVAASLFPGLWEKIENSNNNTTNTKPHSPLPTKKLYFKSTFSQLKN